MNHPQSHQPTYSSQEVEAIRQEYRDRLNAKNLEVAELSERTGKLSDALKTISFRVRTFGPYLRRYLDLKTIADNIESECNSAQTALERWGINR